MKKTVLKLTLAGAFACALICGGAPAQKLLSLPLPVSAADDPASCCDFDAGTGTLTLRGEIVKSEVQTYAQNKDVKSVIAEEGAVFPADCTEMFQRFIADSIDLTGADMSGVTNMSQMFMSSRIQQSLTLSGLDTSRVTDMSCMFSFCSAPSFGLSGLDTAAVTNMRAMFSDCNAVSSIDFSGFDTSAVTNMCGMFSGCSKLTDLDLTGLNTAHVTDMSGMFGGCAMLSQLNISSFDTSSVTNMERMFSHCTALTELNVSHFNTENVTNMSWMFNYCGSLKELDLRNFNTENVTDMSSMFSFCSALTFLDISSFRTVKVTNMHSMFERCTSLTSLDIHNFNTNRVTDMSVMFHYCLSLKSLNLNGVITANVTNMSSMFSFCRSLVSLDLSNFNTTNVTNMGNMFESCYSLTSVSLRSFNTANVTSMNAMFNGCRSIRLLDLSSFNTASVTVVSYMFNDCKKLEIIEVSERWNLENVTKSDNMFWGCTELTGGNGTVYDKEHSDCTYAHIDGDGGPGYLSRGQHAGFDAVSSEVLTGDLDGNGTASIADAVMLARYCAEDADVTLTAQGKLNADCNHDGLITADDLIHLLRSLAGISEATDDADGDGLLDFNDPYPEEAFDRRFEIVNSYAHDPSIDFVDTRYRRSQLCHAAKEAGTTPVPQALGFIMGDLALGTHSLPSLLAFSKPNLIGEIAAQLLTVKQKFDWGPNPDRLVTASDAIDHASEALTRYFWGFGLSYTYTPRDVCEMISCSENNLDHLHTNLTWTMKCAEQALKDDSHIILATKSNSQMKAGCNVDRGAADGGLACMSSSVDTKYQRFPSSDEDVGTIYFNYLNRDWINTVGECGAAIVADVSRSGDTYTMKYRYIFKDIYEWAAHYDTTGNFNPEPSYSLEPGALHWFHEVGAAEEYLMRGEFEGELTWTAGQTAFDEGVFEAVKQTVQNRVSAKAWLEGNEYDRFEQAIEANPRTPENWQEAYDRIQKKFIF